MDTFNPEKTVKDLKNIPENLRGLYKEVKEGDKITGYKLIDAVSKAISGDDLKAENQKLRDEKKEADEKLKAESEKLRKEIDESNAKFKELEEKINQTKPEKDPPADPPANKNGKKDDDLKIALLEKKFNNQISSMQKEMEVLKEEKKQIQETAENQAKQALQQKKESLVLEAIREKGGVPTLLKDHVLKNVSFDEKKSGREALFVVDEEGLPKFQGSQKMGIDNYLDELKKDDDYSRAFVEGKKGMGLNNFNGKGTEIKDSTFSLNMSPKEEADYILKHGKEAYLEATKKLSDEQTQKTLETYKKSSHSESNLMPTGV